MFYLPNPRFTLWHDWAPDILTALTTAVSLDKVVHGGLVRALAPAGMGVSVDLAVLKIAGQGLEALPAANLAIAAADPQNPRVDLVQWNQAGQAYLKTGTPTAGATLANPQGAPAQDPGVLAALVLVPAGATTVAQAQILNAARVAL